MAPPALVASVASASNNSGDLGVAEHKPEKFGLMDGIRCAACDETWPCEMSRLRAAAERVCWFDWSSNDDDAVAAIDALRETLKQ